MIDATCDIILRVRFFTHDLLDVVCGCVPVIFEFILHTRVHLLRYCIIIANHTKHHSRRETYIYMCGIDRKRIYYYYFYNAAVVSGEFKR